MGTDIRIVIEFDTALAQPWPERDVEPFRDWDLVNAWDMKGDALSRGVKDYRFYSALAGVRIVFGFD